MNTWFPLSKISDLPVHALQQPPLDHDFAKSVLEYEGEHSRDVLSLTSRADVLHCVRHVFELDGVVATLGLDEQTMTSVITTIGERYLPNFYHNVWHAADVTFMNWRLLHMTGCAEWMSALERLAALLAAFGHDVGHPGVNNQYLVNTGSDLALLHNDHSPLENMHSSILCGIIRDEGLFSPLAKADTRSIRSIIISAVLCTDMKNHFEQIADLKAFRNAYCLNRDPDSCSRAVQTNRRFFIDMFMHASDISNSCKPWAASRSWSLLIQDEFYTQGDREREEGLPVAAMFDRGQNSVALGQLNFSEHLAMPLFSVLAEIFPPVEPLCSNLLKNMEKWATIRNEEIQDQQKLNPASRAVAEETQEVHRRSKALDSELRENLRRVSLHIGSSLS